MSPPQQTPTPFPPENIEPDILREMKIPPPPKIPEWQPYIKGEDLEDFNKRDKAILLTLSIFEQKTDYLLDRFDTMQHSLRYLESEMIRQRQTQAAQIDELKQYRWRWRFLTWAGVTIGGGSVAALTKKVLDHFWP